MDGTDDLERVLIAVRLCVRSGGEMFGTEVNYAGVRLCKYHPGDPGFVRCKYQGDLHPVNGEYLPVCLYDFGKQHEKNLKEKA